MTVWAEPCDMGGACGLWVWPYNVGGVWSLWAGPVPCALVLSALMFFCNRKLWNQRATSKRKLRKLFVFFFFWSLKCEKSESFFWFCFVSTLLINTCFPMKDLYFSTLRNCFLFLITFFQWFFWCYELPAACIYCTFCDLGVFFFFSFFSSRVPKSCEFYSQTLKLL